MGARLRAVDGRGRIGLVSTWRNAYRVIDVHAGRWLAVSGVPDRSRVEACLTRDGRLICGKFNPYGAENAPPFLGLWEVDLRSGGERLIGGEDLPAPAQMSLSRDDAAIAYAYLSKVNIVDVARGGARVLECAYNEIVQAMAYDATDRVLVVATYGRVLVYRVHDAGGELVESWRIPHADVLWCGIASSRAAVVWVRERELAVTAYAPWDPAGVVGASYEWPGPVRPGRRGPGPYATSPTRAALSPDGKLVALVGNVGGDYRVDVHNLETGQVQSLDGHTDDVHLVEFTTTGHELITADHDNRVLVRPRIGDRIVEPTLEVDVPDEPVAFPDLAGA